MYENELIQIISYKNKSLIINIRNNPEYTILIERVKGQVVVSQYPKASNEKVTVQKNK